MRKPVVSAPVTILSVCLGCIISAAEIAPDKGPLTAVAGQGLLEVRRQDHGEFRINRSVLNTPLQIGTNRYNHGLGTHSHSEIVVRLPAPGKRFTAKVGIDNNHDTKGKKGSVVFLVEVRGKTMFKSTVLRGGAEPVTVDVDLGGAKSFTLRITDGGDGPSWDQSDWCDPIVTLSDGKALRLNKLPVKILKKGKRERTEVVQVEKPEPGKCIKTWTLSTADTKLTIGATDKGQLCIYGLSNAGAQWNWTTAPSLFSFVGRADVGGTQQVLRWEYVEGDLSTEDGQKLTVRFACKKPALELKSIWHAREGRGPVRQTLFIRNTFKQTVTLYWQPTLDFDLAGPTDGTKPFTLWTFHSDGGTPDPTGVFKHSIEPGFARQIRTSSKGEFIPYAVIDGGSQGVYVGVEWSYCQIRVSALEGEGNLQAPAIRIRGGNDGGFRVNIGPQETFDVPPGFVGAYKGDVDDAGNSLRKYLFSYSMPEVVRKDPSYPKVQWNAFGATGDKKNSWNCVERKYYPLIDDIEQLGFEEVMIDVGWWKGGTRAPEPETDPADWPSGMAKAAEYAHKAGLRFGLYWNKGEDMANPEGRERRICHIRRLYNEYKADMWRSDNTGGTVVGNSYRAVKGFYDMLDQSAEEISGFQWENCCAGGRIKDFGAMKRCVKVFITDTYAPLHVRQAFYDSSFALHPVQLEGCVGKVRPRGALGMKFAFRSTSMGAPEWFLDAPNGGNGWGAWNQEEKNTIKEAVMTYKTRIRPLVRSSDLYHIFPRPNGRYWDGVQYYDPGTCRGVVYIFKPSGGKETQRIKLRGLDPERLYRVAFEDGTNPEAQKSGKELMEGLDVTLKGAPVSELMFLEQAE